MCSRSIFAAVFRENIGYTDRVRVREKGRWPAFAPFSERRGYDVRVFCVPHWLPRMPHARSWASTTSLWCISEPATCAGSRCHSEVLRDRFRLEQWARVPRCKHLSIHSIQWNANVHFIILCEEYIISTQNARLHIVHKNRALACYKPASQAARDERIVS